MHDFHVPHFPTDLLDHMILDICELEDLEKRLTESLASADLETIPRGPMAVQLMDVLFRLKETSGELHRLSGHQIKKAASALASDLSGDGEPIRPDNDRVLVDAIEG